MLLSVLMTAKNMPNTITFGKPAMFINAAIKTADFAVTAGDSDNNTADNGQNPSEQSSGFRIYS